MQWYFMWIRSWFLILQTWASTSFTVLQSWWISGSLQMVSQNQAIDQPTRARLTVIPACSREYHTWRSGSVEYNHFFSMSKYVLPYFTILGIGCNMWKIFYRVSYRHWLEHVKKCKRHQKKLRLFSTHVLTCPSPMVVHDQITLLRQFQVEWK